MKAPQLARAGVIAALYVVLCLALGEFAYGPIQVRVSEALTLLPILCPEAILGVTLGCFLANLIGSAPIDIVVGTLITLLAALATRRLRGIRWKGLPVLASLPAVLFNAVGVGIMITILYTPGAGTGMYLFNMLTVGIGQIISCCALGLPLIWAVEKNRHLRRLVAGGTGST